MRYRALFLVLLVALSVSDLCGAQTDYSLRIRSLDVALAGLLDDYLTDIYLNPARLSALERSTIYGGNFPQQGIQSPFPVPGGMYLYGSDPTEDEFFGSTYPTEAVALSWIGRWLGKVGVSIGGSVAEHARETLRHDHWSNQSTYDARLRENANGDLGTAEHYAVDISAAPLSSGPAFGIEIRASYDRLGDEYASAEDEYTWRLDDLANPRRWYYSHVDGRQYDYLTGHLAAGFYGPSGILQDAVVTILYVRESATGRSSDTRLEDTDPDGNGMGWSGEPPYWSYENAGYDLYRDYSGFGSVVRLHLKWNDRLRSTHSAGWTRTDGDGANDVSIIDQQQYSAVEERLNYAYDGTMDRWSAVSSIGFHEWVSDDILFALGAQGSYSRTAFREDASGEVVLSSTDAGEISGSYRQAHDNDEDLIAIAIPLGIEWTCHRYVTLRFGAAMTAYRRETERRLDRDAEPILEDDLLPPGVGLDHHEGDVASDVSVRLNTGLAFNFKDRLVVDLGSSVDGGSINFASYSYLTARVYF